MASNERDLLLIIDFKDTDSEEDFENMSMQLINELNISNVKAELNTKEENQEGTRGDIIQLFGEIILSVFSSGAAVSALNILNQWVKERERSILIEIDKERLKIDAKGLDKDQMSKLIDKIKNKMEF